MPKKVIIVVILFVVAGIGLYAIAVLSGKVDNTNQISNQDQTVPVQEDKGVVQDISNLLGFDKPNSVSVGKIQPGQVIMINSVKLERHGYVVVYRGMKAMPIDVLGYSRKLSGGVTENVEISLRSKLEVGQIIYLGFRIDDGDGYFEITGKYDKHVERADGSPILEKVTVEKN